MNMVQMQGRLKDLSDDQLMQQMQSPDGTAPQFLVLTELKRRRDMRKAGNIDNQQAPPLSQSIPAEISQAPMDRGIQQRPMQGFQQGGIVGPIIQNRLDYLRDYSQKQPSIAPGVMSPEEVQRRLRQSQENRKSPTFPLFDWYKDRADKFRGGLQDFMGGVEEFANENPWADRFLRQPWEDDTLPGFRDEERRIPDIERDIEGGAGSDRIPIQEERIVPPMPDFEDDSLPRPEGRDIPSGASDDERLDILEGVEAMDQEESQSQKDYFEGVEEKMRRILEGVEDRKDSAINYGLMEAGLGILASDSPYALQAVGEGGLPALASVREAMRSERDLATQMLPVEANIAGARAGEDRARREEALTRRGQDLDQRYREASIQAEYDIANMREASRLKTAYIAAQAESMSPDDYRQLLVKEGMGTDAYDLFMTERVAELREEGLDLTQATSEAQSEWSGILTRSADNIFSAGRNGG